MKFLDAMSSNSRFDVEKGIKSDGTIFVSSGNIGDKKHHDGFGLYDKTVQTCFGSINSISENDNTTHMYIRSNTGDLILSSKNANKEIRLNDIGNSIDIAINLAKENVYAVTPQSNSGGCTVTQFGKVVCVSLETYPNDTSNDTILLKNLPLCRDNLTRYISLSTANGNNYTCALVNDIEKGYAYLRFYYNNFKTIERIDDPFTYIAKNYPY